jgi:hypothetical protein
MHVRILAERASGFTLARTDFVLSEHFFQRGNPMQIHFIDFVTAANLLVLLGIYRKLSIIVYQHKLMWTDFADRKGISANGKHAASV